MRRCFLLVTSLIGLAACGSAKRWFTSHGDVAAEAGKQRLSSERLAKVLAGPRGLKVNKDAADFVTNLWVDYTLFAEAAADKKLPTDSASAAQALWPEIAEIRTNHWHDSLIARRPAPAGSAAESLYNSPDARIFQHILFGAQASAKPEVRAAARKKADATLARLKGGADFGQIASQTSDDPGSKQDHGFLPPGPRGRFVPTFDSAAWALAPGGMSGVVESPFGYHIIKRPAEAAVQDRLLAFLGQSGGRKADSLYMEGLAKANALEVKKDAAATVKTALQNPEASRSSGKQLTTFKGGGLTEGEFLKWVRALPPQYMTQLKVANDSMVSQFARVLSLNLLLLKQADSAKVQLTSPEWTGLYGRYNASIDSLRSDMGFAATDSAGKREVNGKVDQYFDRLLSGQVRLRPMPSTLGTVLRERGQYRIDQAGVARGLDLALAQQAKADSGRKGGPAPNAGFEKAPGPPPVPAPAPTTDTTKKMGGTTKP